MGLIPTTKNGKILFFNSKVAPWTANATAIGTTTAEVTAMNTKVVAAQAALDAQAAAFAAAETATQVLDDALAALVNAGSDIIKQIRTKAAISGPNVYNLAEIPAPATPTGVTTLGKPGDFTVELDESGALTLTWKCASPRATGTVYQVFRRATPTGEFTYLGGSGQKKFVDSTIPAGSSQVTYQIQAVRSTAVGPWAQFNVNFGTSSGGTLTASVSETATAKVAA